MTIYKNFSKNIVDLILNTEGIRIRISQIEALNDPLEFSGSWDKLHPEEIQEIEEAIIAENKEIDPQNSIHMETLRKELKNLQKDSISYITDFKKNLGRKLYGIISFSENSKSIPMWAYYSENHTGFSLAFDRKKIEETVEKKEYLIGFKNVTYDNEIPKNPDESFESKLRYLSTKNEDWKHECELRIIAELDQLEDIGLDINGHPIYIETFPFEYILEIRLGLFSSDLLERKIRYWRDKFAPHIKITKAKIKEGAYDFEFSDLDTHLTHQTSKND